MKLAMKAQRKQIMKLCDLASLRHKNLICVSKNQQLRNRFIKTH